VCNVIAHSAHDRFFESVVQELLQVRACAHKVDHAHTYTCVCHTVHTHHTQRGADLLARNADSQTPQMLARASGQVGLLCAGCVRVHAVCERVRVCLRVRRARVVMTQYAQIALADRLARTEAVASWLLELGTLREFRGRLALMLSVCVRATGLSEYVAAFALHGFEGSVRVMLCVVCHHAYDSPRAPTHRRYPTSLRTHSPTRSASLRRGACVGGCVPTLTIAYVRHHTDIASRYCALPRPSASSATGGNARMRETREAHGRLRVSDEPFDFCNLCMAHSSTTSDHRHRERLFAAASHCARVARSQCGR
jgi:hypothetical protein